MTDHHLESHYDTEWIQAAYFSDPSRRMTIDAGDVLMEPGDFNNRLYYIVAGAVTGYRAGSQSEEPVELFNLSAGTYLGLHSFFSRHYASYAHVIAQEETVLAWIDSEVKAVAPEIYGSLADQFMPVIVGELYQRQMRILDAAEERSQTVRRLHQAEKMTTLGQLAAGLAHELNNAIGVISRNSDQLANFLESQLSTRFPRELQWFLLGHSRGQYASSREIRHQAAHYQTDLGLTREQARQLARMAPNEQALHELGPDTLTHLGLARRFWEAGRDSHDMQRASRHAVAIVRSVKNLGRSDQQRDDQVSVSASIEEAMALLNSEMRQVDVRLKFGQVCPISGNASELVQVWVNLIKNAYDALHSSAQQEREIRVTSSTQRRNQRNWCCVDIRDNGPGIPNHLLTRIFEPSFTTKQDGLSFGLGLGLAIVARIVEAHNGLIHVTSEPGCTCFQVLLPCSLETNRE